MVQEVGILFWIKQLQQRRRRITLVTTTHLVHLANNDRLRGYSRTNIVEVFISTLPPHPQRCKVLWWASLSVSLSVCLLAWLKPHVQTSRNVLLVMARSPSEDNGICYVLSVLWTTSCFHIMAHVGKVNISHTRTMWLTAVCRSSRRCYVWSSSPGGSTNLWLSVMTICRALPLVGGLQSAL